MMGRRFFRRLARDSRGNAITEFALTAPLFLMVLMGIFDFSWQFYAKEVLQGAVAKAGRASTMEGVANSQTAIDTQVREQVQRVFKDANVTFVRAAYDSYDDIGNPESYTDANHNGHYDSGECFEDVNGNGNWDTDRGSAGNGGADDVVLYTATMTITRILPIWKMLGQSQIKSISAKTILRNQPYNTSTTTNKVICT